MKLLEFNIIKSGKTIRLQVYSKSNSIIEVFEKYLEESFPKNIENTQACPHVDNLLTSIAKESGIEKGMFSYKKLDEKTLLLIAPDNKTQLAKIKLV